MPGVGSTQVKWVGAGQLTAPDYLQHTNSLYNVSNQSRFYFYKANALFKFNIVWFISAALLRSGLGLWVRIRVTSIYTACLVPVVNSAARQQYIQYCRCTVGYEFKSQSSELPCTQINVPSIIKCSRGVRYILGLFN